MFDQHQNVIIGGRRSRKRPPKRSNPVKIIVLLVIIMLGLMYLTHTGLFQPRPVYYFVPARPR